MIRGAGSDWVGISLLAGYMILQDPKSRSTATIIVDKMSCRNRGGGGEWGGDVTQKYGGHSATIFKYFMVKLE